MAETSANIVFKAVLEGMEELQVLKKEISDLEKQSKSLASQFVATGKSNDNLKSQLTNTTRQLFDAKQAFNALSSETKTSAESLASLSKVQKETGEAFAKGFNTSQMMEMQHVVRSVFDELAAGQGIVRALMVESGRMSEVISQVGVGGFLKGASGMFLSMTGIIGLATQLGPLLLEALTAPLERAKEIEEAIDRMNLKLNLSGSKNVLPLQNADQIKSLLQNHQYDSVHDNLSLIQAYMHGSTNVSADDAQKIGDVKDSQAREYIVALTDSISRMGSTSKETTAYFDEFVQALQDPQKYLLDQNQNSDLNSAQKDEEEERIKNLSANEQLVEALKKVGDETAKTIEQQIALAKSSGKSTEEIEKLKKAHDAITASTKTYATAIADANKAQQQHADLVEREGKKLADQYDSEGRKSKDAASDISKLEQALDQQIQKTGAGSSEAQHLAEALAKATEEMTKLANAAGGLNGGQGGDSHIWGTPSPKGEMADYIRQAATKRGIDPETAVRVAQSEGLNSYVGDNGSSFGPFQLHYGGVAGGGNAVSGLGDTFTKQTGLDARDQSTWKQQVDFALDQAKQGGWGPWHGAQRIGLGNWEGINSAPTVAHGGTGPETASQQAESKGRDSANLQATLAKLREDSEAKIAKLQADGDDHASEEAEIRLDSSRQQLSALDAYIQKYGHTKELDEQRQKILNQLNKEQGSSIKADQNDQKDEIDKKIAELKAERAEAEKNHASPSKLAGIDRQIDAQQFKKDQIGDDGTADAKNRERTAKTDKQEQDRTVKEQAEAENQRYALEKATNARENQLQLDRAKQAGQSEQQITQLKQQQLTQQEALEQQHNAKLKTIYQGDITQQKQIDNQTLVQHQQFLQQHEQLTAQAAQQEKQQWQQVADSMAGALSGAISSMISGHQKLGQVAKQVGTQMLNQFISMAMKMVMQKLVANAMMQASDKTTALLGQTVNQASQTAQTTATMAGVAARTAAQNVGATGQIQKVVQTATSAISAGAGQTAAGVSGNVAPEAGPAAPAIGAAAGASIMGIALGMLGGSFDKGSWELGSDMVAMVHKGEMIVPAGPAQAWRNEFDGGPSKADQASGDTHVHNHFSHEFNISAIDSKSVKKMFDDHGSALMQSINKQVRQGTHMALSQNPKRIR